MAPLLKQKKDITSAGAGTESNGYVDSRTITPDANFAVGSVLVLVINLSGASNTISSVTASGLTWTRQTSASINGSSSGSDLATEVWTAVVSTSAAPTITMTAAGAVLWGVSLREYTGVATSSFVLAAGTAIDPDYILSHPVSATGPSIFGSLVIAGMNCSRGNGTINSGGGFGNVSVLKAESGLPYLTAAVQDRIQSATGTQSATFNTPPPLYERGVLFILVLKAAVTSVPSPPTDLVASAGATSASLSWAPVPGAESYTVERATTAGGSYTEVVSALTETNYTNTGLTTGQTYYYRVKAVNSIGSSAATLFAPVTTAVRPAPNFLDWFENGTQPSLDAGAMRQSFRAKAQQWFGFVLTSENTPGTPIPGNSRLPGPVRRIKAPDQGFYPDSNSRNGTVSEGIGYGMLFAAWLSNIALEVGVYWSEAKGICESLYRYYDFHKNERGLMNWHIYANGVAGDFNGATDGDFDVVEALRVMSELHGDDGPINFGLECDRLLDAIEKYEFVPETGYAFPNLMLCGDGWGVNTDIYMADYARIGYWREWSKWLRKRGRTARADRWERIIDANLDFMQTAYIDSTTYTAGVPDRQTRTFGTIGGDYNNQITYNSVRLGFGFTTDPLWHGDDADPRCAQMVNKIANRAKEVFTTGANVKAPNYSPNLSSYQGYANLTGFGYIGSCSLLLLANRTFATEIFNQLSSSNEYSSSYFNGGIGVYALALMSGASQPFSTEGSGSPEEPDPTKIRVIPHVYTGTQWAELDFVTSVA